jgi:hypothetical protein
MGTWTNVAPPEFIVLNHGNTSLSVNKGAKIGELESKKMILNRESQFNYQLYVEVFSIFLLFW